MIPSTKLAKAILFCNIFYGVFLTAIMIFAWLAAHGKSQVVSVVWIYPVASLLWAWASWLAYKSINKLRRAFESRNKTLE
jgi:drug/metabolite transporter (DMT)-like permease